MSDSLSAIGDPELRATLLRLGSLPVPATAQAVADEMAVHPNVARSRLDRLAMAGLVTVHFERRSGRTGPGAGRPAKVYEVAPQLREVEFPARATPALVAALSQEVDDAGLVDAGRTFADELLSDPAGPEHASLAEAAAALCKDLSSAGFHAHLQPSRHGAVVIETPACPLRPFVRRQQRLALTDRGMWEALLQVRTKGDVALSCLTEDCGDDGVCRIVVEVKPS